MRKIVSEILVFGALVLVFSSCDQQRECKYQPNIPPDFTDSTYMQYPIFNEMIGINEMKKKYYNLQDTIEVTFTKYGVETGYGTKDSQGCYASISKMQCISISLMNGDIIGRRRLSATNNFGSPKPSMPPTSADTIATINFNGADYNCTYIVYGYMCNGKEISTTYRGVLLLANSIDGLNFIRFPNNISYYLVKP